MYIHDNEMYGAEQEQNIYIKIVDSEKNCLN